MKFLGDTVEKIAVEKCGIIKPNSRVVLYPQNKESVIDIARNTARELNSAFIIPDIKRLNISEENIDFTRFDYKGRAYKIRLAGRHQVYNALTAIETAEAVLNNKPVPQNSAGKSRFTPEEVYAAVYNGLEKTFFPARFEVLSKNPLIIFDGAHNISAVPVLKETIKNLLPDKKIILICGMMKDKNPEEALKEICAEPFVHKFTAVPVDSLRSETPENLCALAAQYCGNAGYNHDIADAIKNALDEINASEGKDFAVICFGSLYLAGEVKNLVKKNRP
jgi:dihydrofolate synthase/folylpolyglutamate synthase